MPALGVEVSGATLHDCILTNFITESVISVSLNAFFASTGSSFH